MRTVVVIAALCVSACALDGQPIRDWSLDFGATHDVAVTLPSNFLDVMPPTGGPFTLRANIAVDAGSRGRPLTLVIPCFHDELALTVDGVAIDDAGDIGVGEHRYVLSAAQTDRDRLAFELAAHRNLVSFGFTVEPRLVAGVAGPTPSAVFDRALGVIELVLIGAFSLLYGLLYLLDRTRRAEGVFVIQSLAAVVSVLSSIGVLGALVGDAASGVFGISLNIVNLALLAYISYALDLGPPSRRWFGIYIVLSCVLALAPLSTALSVAMLKIEFVVGLVFTAHVFRKLWTARRRYRVDATLLLAAQVIAILGGSVDIIQISTAHNVMGGFHVGTVGIFAWALAQAIVLARRHVASEREVERVNAELRRQVAAHSRELVAALDEIAKLDEPDPIIDGRYRLVRQIGAGGMGTVHEVERISDQAHLALKLVRGATPEALARFGREAQVAAELRHANLVPVIDIGVAKGSLYLVMPLADGSLESARDRFGDPAWARGLLASIARGLAALHAHGVVHRDLKPANILLADGIPQIADFGLASLRIGDLADTTPSNLTRAGDVLGTLRYMAPEVATGIRDVGPSSDIFSFGLIAHELLTGRSAFAEPPVLARRSGRPIVAPVLDGIDPIIARCLALAPETRPTAAELVAALAKQDPA